MMHRAVNKPGVHVPDTGMQYPDDPFQRLLKVKQENSSEGKYQFDGSYPYVDRSFGYRLNQAISFFVKWLLAAPINRLHFGLRIQGRENLALLGGELEKGIVMVCNHVYVFDALAVNQAVRPWRRIRIPMFAKHFNGGLGYFLRGMGGIPVPEESSGVRPFNEAIDYFHGKGDSILVFPEAVRWNWYQPIRPFRRGAFTIAWRLGCPVLPLVLTYRKRRGLYRLFGPAKTPCVTIHIGKPVGFDRNNPRKAEIDRVREETHRRMEEMAGIVENPWPAIPADE